MDNYADWAAKQVTRRRRPVLYVVGGLVALIAFAWLYDTGKNYLTQRNIEVADTQLNARLDQQLDAYLASFAPALRLAGFSVSQFRDTSKPAYHAKDLGTFTPSRERELVRGKANSEFTITVGITTGPVKLNDVEKAKQSGLAASTRLSIRIRDKRDCYWMPEVVMMAARRPVGQPGRGGSDDTAAKKRLSFACEENKPVSVPTAGITGELMPTGTWWARVANSKDAILLGDVGLPKQR